MRKMMIASALALAAAVPGTATTASVNAADQADKPAAPYVHVVVFHLKKDAPKDAVDGLIADAHSMLRKIPSVRDLRIGWPPETATPQFAQKDYQVGLVVLFDDAEGLKTYLDHPLHLQYVDKHLKHVATDKLLVYDFVNQKK
jgi:hypothetical protein